MTANQINYQRVVEERRKNLAAEAETARHNREIEGIQSAGVAATLAGVGENRRHNQEQELINWYTTQWQGQRAGDQSSIESQLAQVQGKQAQLRESELAEAIRHNTELESEAARHNLQMEISDASRAAAQQQDADTRSVRIFTDLAAGILRSFSR